MGIDQPEPLERASYADLGIFYLLVAKSRLSTHRTRGFVREDDYTQLTTALGSRLHKTANDRFHLISTHSVKLFEQSLHMIAIKSEQRTLRLLYNNDEISESVYRRLNSKLELQREMIENAQHDEIDPSLYTDRKDVFEHLANAFSKILRRKLIVDTPVGKLQYYRAQMIMARKVTKTLDHIQHDASSEVFIPEVLDSVMSLYEQYREQNARKLDSLLDRHTTELSPYLATLAKRGLDASGGRALEYLEDKGLVDEDVEERIQHLYGEYAREP